MESLLSLRCGGWPHMLLAERGSASGTCQNLQNSDLGTSFCTWRYKLASVCLAFDYLWSIRSFLVVSGFSKVFIDILVRIRT